MTSESELRGAGRIHSVLEGGVAARLRDWSRGRGEVGIRWSFRLPEEVIPDIAYLSYADSRGMTQDELDEPRVPPTAAVEILGPRDSERRDDQRIGALLEAGTPIVVVVDALTDEVEAHTLGHIRRFRRGEVFEDPALPGLRISVDELFDSVRH
jgi:Uma2 family endonuclease